MSDGYLIGLITSVNQGAPAPRVLLVVSGLVVTGTLMARDTYRAAFAAAGGTAALAQFDETVAALQLAEADRTRYPEDAVRDSLPGYVFLCDATVAGHVGALPLWQGLVATVSGFSILPAVGVGGPDEP